MTDLPEISDAQAIIDAARTIAAPVELDPEKPQAFALPNNAHIEVPDLAAWRSRPARRRGIYQPATVDALIAYVERYGDAEATTVWVDPDSGTVEAVLNDNAPVAAGWGDYRAVLQLELTPEWRYWMSNDQRMLSQEDFAEHIEGGLDEIIEPDAADMLELAQNFHATSGATFRSAIRLASGQQQLQYDEEVQATAGARGDMTVPTRFLLAIAPFVGEEPYRLAARLRFRVSNGRLGLGYWLDRPDKVKRDAIEKIAERLGERFQNVYVGQPVQPTQLPGSDIPF